MLAAGPARASRGRRLRSLDGRLRLLLAVNAEDGLVTIRLARDTGKTCAVIVGMLGEAEAEYEDTVAAFEDLLSGGTPSPASRATSSREQWLTPVCGP